MGLNYHVSTTLHIDWHFKGFPRTKTRSNGLQGTLFKVPCHVPPGLGFRVVGGKPCPIRFCLDRLPAD